MSTIKWSNYISAQSLKDKIEDLIDLDEVELYNLRIYSFLAMIFVPVYGCVLIHFLPDAIEYISHRIIIGLYWGAILCVSFIYKENSRYFAVLFFIGNLILIFWVTWIVALNNYEPNYSLGLFMLFCCCLIIATSRIEMIVYTSVFYILTNVTFLYLDHIEISPQLYFVSTTIVVVVYFIVMVWRVRTVSTLQQLNHELSFKNEELERFVFAVSHDLKSPLRTIGSFSSLLQRRINSGQTDSVEEYTDFIISGVNRMTQVIEDILDYSRYGNSKVHFQEVALRTIIQEVKKDTIGEEEKGTIKIDLSKNFPDKIIGNALQVKQIFQNLIENALKYNVSNHKKVWLNYKESKDFHCFEVEDNGIGIDPQYKEKIFDLFQRLHHSNEFNGTGIGLAICKRIIENHQGKIDVRERNGGGTIFQFQIKKALS